MLSRPPQAGSVTVGSNSGTECEPSLIFDSKNKVMNHVELYLTAKRFVMIKEQVIFLNLCWYLYDLVIIGPYP